MYTVSKLCYLNLCELKQLYAAAVSNTPIKGITKIHYSLHNLPESLLKINKT